MKINNKIFSFPPYISTCWSSIAALHMKGSDLLVTLKDGEGIRIPDLDTEMLQSIFEAHGSHLEEQSEKTPPNPNFSGASPFQQIPGMDPETEFPFRFGINTLDNWGAALQHNPEQADTPPLPPEVLDKIKSIAKIISPDDAMSAPKPEPHCNCMYCQIARAIHNGLETPEAIPHEEIVEEEPIPDEELEFQQWEIIKTDDKLYTVTNRLDKEEKYTVFLGTPVGCTCGIEGCEHLLAVLKS